MQFGYDENRIRIKPSFSGQRAFCPLCNGPIIGKCGEIYIRHWQHHHDRECDPWKEHETDWHRNWKAKFPSDWQEIIIENLGEKHIADIKTPSNIVIEFQNSSISTSTIRIRENFYKNMIWVVNANDFKQNLILRSAVNSGLREIELKASYDLSSIGDSLNEEILSISEEIETNTETLSHKFNSIKYRKADLEKLTDIIHNSVDFTDVIIESWIQGKYYWDHHTSDILLKIDSTIKDELQEKSKAIKQLQSEIELNEKSLDVIKQLSDFSVGEKQFKLVQYEQIASKSFYKARAILKTSRKTFFPEITTFGSEIEFQNYLFRKENYDFIIDPTDAIEIYNSKIKEGKKNVLILEKSIPILKHKIRENMFKELELKIKNTEVEIVQLNDAWDNLLKQNSRLKAKKDILINKRDREITEYRNVIEKERNSQRTKVMKEKKGIYTYGWKHERKSWNAANMPIFFDIGENYLLERIKYGVFKKLIISEFLEKFLLPKSNTQ